MEFDSFFKEIEEKLRKIELNIDEEKAKKLYEYMKLMLEWNEKINLTAITEPKEVILKHFVDSLTILKYLEDGQSLVDVGTGAGFPGIPLNIMNSNCEYMLIDSLNKRIKFLEEVILNLELNKIQAMHGRVEEIGKNKKYREKYDISTSRAVASLNVLLEYLLPLVKVGGKCICMKGSNVDEEIKEAKNAILTLGGEIESIEKIVLPESDIVRNIIVIKKVKNTPAKYPRKPGTPAKEPI